MSRGVSRDQDTGFSKTIGSIYSIYKNNKKGMGIAGIALLSIPYMYTIYTEGGGTTVTNAISLINPLLKEGIGLPLFAGLLRKDELDGNRALIITRVSTPSQGNNSSKSSQREALEKDAKEDDLEIVDVLEAEESGAKINREQLNKAIEAAQNDEYDILMVYEFDRLSRANPLDTQGYLLDIRDAGITLYTHADGYYDWTDPNDFELLSREAAFARRWLNRLSEGSAEGCRQQLKNRKWPFGGSPPVGYTTDEDREIHLDSDYGQFIPKFFEVFAATENRSETQDRLNTTLENNGLDEVSYSQVKTLLQNELCMGKLSHKGEIVAEYSDLKMVGEDLFQKVQSIFSEQKGGTSSSDIPDFIGEAAQKYGIDFVMNLFESFKPFRCRQCDGDLERMGTKELWGVKFPKYECQSCEYQGPLVTEEELKKIHQTLPLRCPFCSATEEFETTRLREMGTKFDYFYTCEDCGLSFGCDLGPNQMTRRFDYPNLGFEVSDDDDNDDDDDDDDPQSAIDDFCDP